MKSELIKKELQLVHNGRHCVLWNSLLSSDHTISHNNPDSMFVPLVGRLLNKFSVKWVTLQTTLVLSVFTQQPQLQHEQH